MSNRRLAFIILAASGLYGLGQLFWYWQTPLGQSPVLDGQENLILAEQIADGSLAKEPFYRAMLYPAAISLFSLAGVEQSTIPFLAGLLGLILHLICSFCAIRLSYEIWQTRTSIIVTGILTGLNPVLLHFAVDPLDVTLANALFIAGLLYLKNGYRSKGALIFAGVLISLASLARPHFIPPLLTIGIVSLGLAVAKIQSWAKTAKLLAGLATPLLLYGSIQFAWSGSFSILPWQGAYNLWASNGEGANGLYLRQKVLIQNFGEHRNPTRIESEELYKNAFGHLGSIEEQARHWRHRTVAHVLANPMQWLKLMAFKSYALINNFEQYNNKTYSFHKDLSPWLRFNPIGFGISILLGTIGMSYWLTQNRSDASYGLLIISSFAVGVIIYMASARFRLPLVPLLAILSGGAYRATKAWIRLQQPTKWLAPLGLCILTILVYSQWNGIASNKTNGQDMMLIADASAKLGKDNLAYNWAETAQSVNGPRSDATRLQIVSHYNLVASNTLRSGSPKWEWISQQAQTFQFSDPTLDYVIGIAHWNEKEPEKAIERWMRSIEKYGFEASSSLGALMLTGSGPTIESIPPEIVASINSGQHSVLAIALIAKESASSKEFLITEQRLEAIKASIRRVMPGTIPQNQE